MNNQIKKKKKMRKKLSAVRKVVDGWILLYCLPLMDLTLGQDETHASPILFWQESYPWISRKPEHSSSQ